ncbi:hypothetical protein [Hymenobacter jeollabukensis]|uniref:Uncharacterized protein n=1 Tax=Hymenobacter jeollabukensis TaxID=2025313 RepID=A0A5R8WSW5_9BACT|nr:hypothetical protein [Hymenobacter jeollabukensis]TLM93938.1 hypothetical protein FDY95_07855 [Hymenobacter jeollabukensis]
MFSSWIIPRPFRLLPSAALLLTLVACMREGVEPKRVLPEATQSGLNTAGAKVDGQVWLPATVMFAGSATHVAYQRINGRHELRISLRRVTDTEADPLQQTSIGFYVPDISAPGTVVFNQSVDPYIMVNQRAFAKLMYSKPTPDQEFVTNSAMHGQLTVTRLDTVARIVAGTFDFQAQQRGTTATTSVTEGRFDLRY